MKYTRVFMALAVLGAAACSSPTEPKLPQPDPDDNKDDPKSPGVVAVTESHRIVGLTFEAVV